MTLDRTRVLKQRLTYVLKEYVRINFAYQKSKKELGVLDST